MNSMFPGLENTSSCSSSPSRNRLTRKKCPARFSHPHATRPFSCYTGQKSCPFLSCKTQEQLQFDLVFGIFHSMRFLPGILPSACCTFNWGGLVLGCCALSFISHLRVGNRARHAFFGGLRVRKNSGLLDAICYSTTIREGRKWVLLY